MKIGQILKQDKVVAAIFEGDAAKPIPNYTVIDLLEKAERESAELTEIAMSLAQDKFVGAKPIIPIEPSEVWACGCAYQVSAEWRDAEHGVREGFYAAVYKNQRPELFFKGNARVCTGPGDYIGIRPDSNFMAPEAELVVVMGSNGKVFGYTIGNDVSAWDIERENPLYLPQSKIFDGCSALGPVIVTTDELKDPYNLEISCTIERNGQIIFEGKSTTKKLARKIDEMIGFLLRSNKIPSGSVLMTGTGVIIPAEAALKPEDKVTIRVPEIGELSNVARIV